jgi:hypothetical protein
LELSLDPDRPWQSMSYDISCVGDHFAVVERFGRVRSAPPELARRIEPHARGYRRQRAEAVPGRGGWFPRHLPSTSHGLTADDDRQDQATLPRTDRWMPSWLSSVLDR